MSDRPTPSPLPLGGIPDRVEGSAALPVPKSALAIVAHPDDAEFQCGGTLAAWAAAGCTINHLVLTDGSKGTWDASVDPEALARQRRDEQMEAARRLGSTGKVVILGHPDGELQNTLHVRDQVAYWIRTIAPEIVITHDPWKHYLLHPDHRATGWLALDGVMAARDPLYFGHHGLGPHRVEAVLLFDADQPDHLVDISASLATKIEALLAHESQFVTTHDIDLADPDSTARFRDRVTENARAVGRAGGLDAAEAFKLLDRL